MCYYFRRNLDAKTNSDFSDPGVRARARSRARECDGDAGAGASQRTNRVTDYTNYHDNRDINCNNNTGCNINQTDHNTDTSGCCPICDQATAIINARAANCRASDSRATNNCTTNCRASDRDAAITTADCVVSTDGNSVSNGYCRQICDR
jgi:hypothetical protein